MFTCFDNIYSNIAVSFKFVVQYFVHTNKRGLMIGYQHETLSNDGSCNCAASALNK